MDNGEHCLTISILVLGEGTPDRGFSIFDLIANQSYGRIFFIWATAAKSGKCSKGKLMCFLNSNDRMIPKVVKGELSNESE